MWEMVGAALISSGIVSTLICGFAAMTWGRIRDWIETIKESENKCQIRVTENFDNLYEITRDHGERIAGLESSVD